MGSGTPNARATQSCQIVPLQGTAAGVWSHLPTWDRDPLHVLVPPPSPLPSGAGGHPPSPPSAPPSATARVHSWPHPAAREIVPRGMSDGLATLRKALQGPPLNSAPARCSRGDLASHAPLLSRVLANPVVSVLGPSQAAPRPQMWGVPLRPTESGRGLSVGPFLTPSGLFMRQPSPRPPLPAFRVLCHMYQLPT